MIEIFKRNLFINSLLLLPYAALLRIKTFIDPTLQVPADGQSVLSNIIYSLLPYSILQSIISLLIVFFIANMINRLCIKNRLANTITLIPGLFFILFSSLLPSFLELSESLLSLFFVVAMVGVLMQTYKRPRASDLIFNTGLYTGLAALFLFASTSFMLSAFVGLIILRSFKLKERLQLLLGFLTPFLFFGVYLFYNNILSQTISKEVFGAFSLPTFNLEWGVESIILTSVLALGLLISILGYGFYTSKKSIQAQKKVDILYWVALASLIGLLLVNQVTLSYALFLIFPLSIFISMSFLNIRNKLVLELLHLGAVIAVMGIHFAIIF